jgi:flagellar biosynthesis protein FlhG
MSERLAGSAAGRRQIWSLGGGKGGIGKSMLAAALGYELSRMGKRVILVDADLGGANLHTCLGLAAPEKTLGDFILRRVGAIEDVLVDTGFPGLSLISGASDFLGAANIKHLQKVRVLSRIRSLDVDVVILDLGAGTAFNIIDFFLISDVGLLTLVPEPTSVESSYRFLMTALYRRLRAVAATEAIRQLIDAAGDRKNEHGVKTPLDLLAAVGIEDQHALDPLRREMAAFYPRFVVNEVRTPEDAAVGPQLVTACARHLGIRASYAGHVRHDDTVWRCLRKRRLFSVDVPSSEAAEDVRRLARTLVGGENLAFEWARG